MPRLSAAASASSCAGGSELQSCGAMSAKFREAAVTNSRLSRRGAFCARCERVPGRRAHPGCGRAGWRVARSAALWVSAAGSGWLGSPHPGEAPGTAAASRGYPTPRAASGLLDPRRSSRGPAEQSLAEGWDPRELSRPGLFTLG